MLYSLFNHGRAGLKPLIGTIYARHRLILFPFVWFIKKMAV
jgi:hypothetical protein